MTCSVSNDLAIELNDLSPISTTPFLPSATASSIPSLDEALYPLPETINFSLSTENKSIFYIRDARNLVLIKGVLEGSHLIHLENANGQRFLEIRNSRFAVADDAPAAAPTKYAHTFTVLHGTFRLGIIETNESNLNALSVRNAYEDYNLIISCLGKHKKDILLSRVRNSPPFCGVQVPSCDSGIGSSSFTATLVFPKESFVTRVEECLGIATVISFILTRNKVQIGRYTYGQCVSWFFAVIVFVIFILLTEGWDLFV